MAGIPPHDQTGSKTYTPSALVICGCVAWCKVVSQASQTTEIAAAGAWRRQGQLGFAAQHSFFCFNPPDENQQPNKPWHGPGGPSRNMSWWAAVGCTAPTREQLLQDGSSKSATSCHIHPVSSVLAHGSLLHHPSDRLQLCMVWVSGRPATKCGKLRHQQRLLLLHWQADPTHFYPGSA